MSNHFIVAKIAGISDLELNGRLELLQLEDISPRDGQVEKDLNVRS